MAPKVERITEPSHLGEGPHWDADTQSLYYIDFPGSKLLKYNPATKQLRSVSVAPANPSFIIPVEGKKDHFIISLNNDLVIVSWDGESDSYTKVETVATAELRFNDAKCDSTGRLWVGTLNIPPEGPKHAPPVGCLYSLEGKNNLVKHVGEVRITNGLAFNYELKKLFYIDSRKRTVDQFDFDVVKGTISNRTILFSLEKHNLPGDPDGMTIDTDGNLWVAVWEGNRVIKISGKEPEKLLDSVPIPALQVTSVSWGGPNLDELFVTTAALADDGSQVAGPLNGATYKISGTGSKGLPAHKFKLVK